MELADHPANTSGHWVADEMVTVKVGGEKYWNYDANVIADSDLNALDSAIASLDLLRTKAERTRVVRLVCPMKPGRAESGF